jgi:hypothetical protein
MFINGMRPVHPGEVLREDFLKPLGISASAKRIAREVRAFVGKASSFPLSLSPRGPMRLNAPHVPAENAYRIGNPIRRRSAPQA